MATISTLISATRLTAAKVFGRSALWLLICAAAPAAHAQWQVEDVTGNNTLQQIHDDTQKSLGTTGDGSGHSINSNLDAINKKLVIGQYDNNQPGPRVADPDPALPTAATKLDDGTSCKAIAKEQQAVCQQIIDIENAQYQYMLTMYANSKVRDDMLRKLLQERQAINSSDDNQYGKLENNTNKLTALYTLITLDQQQMQSVNYAYDANLRYLRNQQTLAANAAATGETKDKLGTITLPGLGDIGIGSALSSVAAGAALTTALKGVASSKPSGMQTLAIGESNGW